MGDRNINNSFNDSNFGDNTNIQSDQNKQIKNSDEVISEFKEEVKEKLAHDEKLDEALAKVEELRKAVKENDKDKGKDIYYYFSEIIDKSAKLSLVMSLFI